MTSWSGKDSLLVARDHALAVLDDAMRRAFEGHGRVVLVSGEAGIGKSALATTVARAAEDAGAAVQWGRAWELAEAPPYFPLWPCLRALGVEAAREATTANAYQFWETVLVRLAQASADKPIAWILEDLHGADLQTLDLLTFLVRPLASLRVLVVITARRQDPRLDERGSQRLVRIARDGIEVAPEPLDADDVASLAARVLGHPLAAPAARELAELTGGNPLFVIECARAFRAGGAAPRGVVTLPHTVKQVVLERVGLLPKATRSALEAAAIVGREATAAIVSRMRTTTTADIIDALVHAVDGGLVSETRPGSYVFTHILVRDAIESALTEVERRTLHGAAEVALRASGDQADVLVERARHALAAGDDLEAALALANRAAGDLERLGAWDRALTMRERAAQARAEGLGTPAAPEDTLHLATVAIAAGRHARARELCECLLANATAQRDVVLLARSALVLGSELRPGTLDRALIAALSQARSMLDDPACMVPRDERDRLACVVLARLAAATQPAPNPQEPVAMALEAIERARLLSDDALMLDVLHVAVAALVGYAETKTRVRIEEELLSRAIAADDFVKAMRVQVLLAFDRIEAGDFDAFEVAVDRALDLAQRLGSPRHRWRALLLGAMRAVLHGDASLAERYLVESRALTSVADDLALSLSLGAHELAVARLLHRDDDVGALFDLNERAMRGVPKPNMILGAYRASTYARMGDREKAADGLKLLRSEMTSTAGYFLILEAEASALLRERDRLPRLRERVLVIHDAHISSGPIPFVYEGPRARVVALIDAAMGDVATAERALRECIAVADANRHRPWSAQLRVDLAWALADADRSAARMALEEALGIAEEVGMSGLARRVRAALADMAAVTTVTTVTTPTAPESITAPRTAMTLVSEGDTWLLRFDGRETRVKDSRGMQLLARLVERPGEDIHVLALAGDDPTMSASGDLPDEAADARAKRDYKARLVALDEEIAEAESFGDRGRLAKRTREKEALVAEMARAFGLGGKSRPLGSVSERARVNVQRRLKSAIAHVATVDTAAGRFLEKAVRTGTYCRFFG